jgi:hypothetical protein
MPDFSQAPSGLVPRTVVDHVLLAVRDLDEAAARLEREHGLLAVGGGRHPDLGTANRIVPLGAQYLELIAVADPTEAAAGRLGQRVAAAVSAGQTFSDWALRTEDLEALRRKLRSRSLPPEREGSRERPDGVVLRWRTQELETSPGPSAVPFVIQWEIPDGQHPGELSVQHPGGARGLSKVILAARDVSALREKLSTLLGHSDLYEVVSGPEDGIREVVIDGARGQISVR